MMAGSSTLWTRALPRADLLADAIFLTRERALALLSFRRFPRLLEINPRFGGGVCPYFFSFLRHLT